MKACNAGINGLGTSRWAGDPGAAWHAFTKHQEEWAIVKKICSKCLTEKPFADFYKASAHKDGLRYHCKVCMNKASMAYKALNRDAIAKSLRAWRKKNPNSTNAAYLRYRIKNVRQHTARNELFKKNNPLIAVAWRAVERAKRNGQLVAGPCAVCGETSRTQAHHDDYSRPLDVTWLCQQCHSDEHRLRGRG